MSTRDEITAVATEHGWTVQEFPHGAWLRHPDGRQIDLNYTASGSVLYACASGGDRSRRDRGGWSLHRRVPGKRAAVLAEILRTA